MKKILVGLFALTLVSTSVAFAGPGDKGKKSKKAKTECNKKNCPDKKDCKKTVTCPTKPGCCM
jgi:hypothetical protein